ISPSPLAVLIVFIFTTLPLLLKFVLNLIVASVGSSGTTVFRSVVDSHPKLRTIIKTLSKPSNSLTYAKTLLSFQT
uniref:Uncharacterized protein n=1 Tax=Crocodylus porosus TaxID=8502 RepID=A0A7M4FBW3_CROPO